jgi:6-phosphogluconolactonase (cycloisomerase 2 family)
MLALIAACGTISPRRIVVNNPPGSPTPTVSPTPFSPTPTPTPTATPVGMGAAVPAQFLFTADPTSGVILGFKINSDGGLSPVPGSPFMAPNSPTLVVATGKSLFVADKAGLTAFAVNRDTGTITTIDSVAMPSISNLSVDNSEGVAFATSGTRRTAVRVVNNKLQLGSVSGIMLLRSGTSTLAGQGNAGQQVKDSSGRFSYALNKSTGEISAFQVEGGTLVPLSPASYPAGHGAVSLAIAQP